MILPEVHIFSPIGPAETREITVFSPPIIADSLIRRGFSDGRIGADSQEYQPVPIPRSLLLELVRYLTTCDLKKGQKDEREHPYLDSRQVLVIFGALTHAWQEENQWQACT